MIPFHLLYSPACFHCLSQKHPAPSNSGFLRIPEIPLSHSIRPPRTCQSLKVTAAQWTRRTMPGATTAPTAPHRGWKSRGGTAMPWFHGATGAVGVYPLHIHVEKVLAFFGPSVYSHRWSGTNHTTPNQNIVTYPINPIRC